jgi:hypothetical protein
MKQFDYSTKELVNSLSFTTTTKNRESYTEVVIDGRSYIKCGTLQAITMVGNIWRDNDGNTIMHVGISRQNPNDTKVNKQFGYEIAQLRALGSPDIIINSVPENINNFNFSQMMSWYYDAMKLEFIKTKQEIKNNSDDPQKYNR